MMTLEPIWRFALMIALAAAQMPSRDAAVSAALAELEKGRILESIQQFREIIRTNPTDGSSYFYLSTLYNQMNEYASAERYLKRAMELNPKQGAHYYQLGLIRYRQKQWVAALDLFKQALELGSGNNDIRVWRSIGDVNLDLFNRDAALQAYTEALRLQPRDALTRLAVGRFYLERGEPDQAIEHLVIALEIDPSLRAAYPILGRAYRQSGQPASSVSVLKKAVDTDASDQESRYALGQTLLAMGRADEGREEMEKYNTIRQQVANAEAAYKAALARLDESKFADAEKLLRDAVRIAPTYGPALQSLGKLLLDRGSADKALPFLERAVQSNPLNAASWYNLGTACLKLGKMTEALAAVNNAVTINEDEPSYRQLLTNLQKGGSKK
jgi:tetratricopeptide (TPR) repeat protein